ncbi:MAG: pseudouridine synthase [Monoraphidium minutum]|nr:MAG: pseudouridine synthase [Monoraphidium minutum]
MVGSPPRPLPPQPTASPWHLPAASQRPAPPTPPPLPAPVFTAAAKGLDFSRYRRRYVALHVLYFGGRYQGLARQADSENTIEGHFFAALRHTRLIPPDAEPSGLQYSRCGRTDRGVSALGQVLALQLRSSGRADDPLAAFYPPRAPAPPSARATSSPCNRRALPDDIRVLGWADVPEAFNARWYKYFVVQDGGLDLGAMREAAAALVGEHDFRNFCKADVLQVRNFRRTIMSVSIDPVPATAGGCQAYVLHIRGTAFLWHQVRCIAAVLLMVGRSLEPPSVVASLLDVTRVPSKPQYTLAPDDPLLLFACDFKGIPWFRPPRALGRAAGDVRAALARHLVGAAMCGEVLAALAPHLAAGGAEGGGGGEEGRGAAAAAAAAGVAGSGGAHIPLLRRAREPSLEARFERAGIPLELLNRPGQAGFEAE